MAQQLEAEPRGAIYHRDVPLNDDYPLAVTFITVDDEPAGTGFIINVPLRVDEESVEYIVTAAHVVARGRDTAVRFKTHDGCVKDVPVPADDWLTHPHADVAAAPLGRDGDTHRLHIPSSLMRWPGVQDWHPTLGDRVYFLGLLAVPGTKSLVERNVPMARSGTIGAMYQDRIPHLWPDGCVREFQTHLIDCRSYAGFSGSPCFFQRDHQPSGVVKGTPVEGTHTFLLGLVSGHFEDFAKAKLPSKDDQQDQQDQQDEQSKVNSIEVPINAGVGLVTPVEKIVELLEFPEFKDERERLKQEYLTRTGQTS